MAMLQTMDKCNSARLLFFLFCFLNLNPFSAQGEWFSSIAKLEKLERFQEMLYTSLGRYINRESARIQTLRKLIHDRRIHITMHGKDARDFQLKSPMDSYLILNRFLQVWGKMEDMFSDRRASQDLIDMVQKLSKTFPEDRDYDGARNALIRLYNIYDLQLSAFTQGLLSHNNVTLTALDTYMIGMQALESEKYYTSKEWFEESLRIMGNRNSIQDLAGEVKRVTMLENLGYSNFKLGNWALCTDIYEEILKNFPKYENKESIKFSLRTMKEFSDFKPRRRHKTRDPFDGLCNGNETTYNASHVTLLKCYLSNGHPLFILRPVGVELVSTEPLVMLFHNVLSDKEVDDVISMAMPRLGRALVEDTYTGKGVESINRISQTGWITHSDKLNQRLDRRVEAMTGLSTDTAEHLQVNNYGMGGFYEPHYDHATHSFGQESVYHNQTGNRIATLMFYLSDVEAGGATVFIKQNLRVMPEKGSAVFWYNLWRSGDGDWRSFHAGCPVLLGNKWVANKWFHERGQEFRRPCGMNRNTEWSWQQHFHR